MILQHIRFKMQAPPQNATDSQKPIPAAEKALSLRNVHLENDLKKTQRTDSRPARCVQ
jgi:hypothetical protein